MAYINHNNRCVFNIVVSENFMLHLYLPSTIMINGRTKSAYWRFMMLVALSRVDFILLGFSLLSFKVSLLLWFYEKENVWKMN